MTREDWKLIAGVLVVMLLTGVVALFGYLVAQNPDNPGLERLAIATTMALTGGVLTVLNLFKSK